MVSAFQRLRGMRAARPSRVRGAWWQVPVLALACVMAVMVPARQAGAQGVTTGSIGGTVTDAAGAPVAGASVIAIHTPSGTNYEATTRADGRYLIPNMRVGGPYVLTVTYVERRDVDLDLLDGLRRDRCYARAVARRVA